MLYVILLWIAETGGLGSMPYQDCPQSPQGDHQQLHVLSCFAMLAEGLQKECWSALRGVLG